MELDCVYMDMRDTEEKEIQLIRELNWKGKRIKIKLNY